MPTIPDALLWVIAIPLVGWDVLEGLLRATPPWVWITLFAGLALHVIVKAAIESAVGPMIATLEALHDELTDLRGEISELRSAVDSLTLPAAEILDN